CQSCHLHPCTTACPVDALSATHSYDIDACHAYLNTEAGQDCMTNGCAARRACPVSQRAGRVPEQSNLHMKAFHRK
ncbi:MAG: ferredoxin, partial [Rhodobacteraceae bacterium]|nr:ferredoxin [Paracoccaceae bacterium]